MAILYRRGVSRTILFQCLACFPPKKGSKEEKSFLVTYIAASGGVFGTPGLDIFKLVPCKFREGKLSSFPPPLSRIYEGCTFSAPPSLYSARAGRAVLPPSPGWPDGRTPKKANVCVKKPSAKKFSVKNKAKTRIFGFNSFFEEKNRPTAVKISPKFYLGSKKPPHTLSLPCLSVQGVVCSRRVRQAVIKKTRAFLIEKNGELFYA